MPRRTALGGTCSRTVADLTFAGWFDIDWSRARIVLPVLGDSFVPDELTIEDGELRYFEHRFPIAPGTLGGTPSEVHDRQAYQLVNFRHADTDQNYRRFFAVTTLAGLRVEDPSVFAATHREILRWVNEDAIDGLRVDHPDGLVDPEGYLRQLRTGAPGAWITVEKILEPGESLPAWPVDGTTGYDALTEVTNLFVDPAAEAPMTDLYQQLTGDDRDFHAHVEAGKRHVITTILQAEVSRLVRLVPDRRGRRPGPGRTGDRVPGLPVLSAAGGRVPGRGYRDGRRPASRPGRRHLQPRQPTR